MGYDLDPLDDIFADEPAKNARPAGKFQPKTKFRPQRKESATTSAASSQAVQAIDSAASELNKPIESAEPLEKCSTIVHNENAENGDRHAFLEKSVGENADIFTGLDALGDFLPHTTTDTVTECSAPPSAAVAVNLPNPENIGGLGTPVLSSVEDSTHTCKVDDVPTDPGMSAEVDPMTAAEPIVSSADVHDDVHDRELRREENIMDSINLTELTTKSGQKTGKFQPKPKLQMQKKIYEAGESSSHSLGSQSVPPEIDYAEKDSIPAFQQDDVLDLSSLGFTHTLPTEATSEIRLNEESMTVMEVAPSDSCIHPEGLPEIPAKLASRRAKTKSSKTHATSDPSPQQPKDSISSQENVTGRSLRPRKGKTNFCELVDEDRDEILATGGISEECPTSSAMEEENINNEEFPVENESQKKKLKRKSKKTNDGTEKPAKSKKAKEATEQEGAKHKKFPRATRRRRVDKILLETPEDEIDHHKVPLRDLILLAEHRERDMKKEKAAAGAPAMNQSTGNSSGLYNDKNFTSEQGGEYDDGQRTPMVEDTICNYQTYMDKTPSTRWSKQDTELFYEAVRQFGTDLSLIQLRFPDRTRRQVKLKYKKEERQHPLRLREALTNRSKDLSHFKKAIEHLRQIAAEENQNSNEDDTIDLTGNGGVDEGTSNADDDEAKEEPIEEEEIENVANDFTEVQSPLKSDDDEDDFLRWSQYKSDI